MIMSNTAYAHPIITEWDSYTQIWWAKNTHFLPQPLPYSYDNNYFMIMMADKAEATPTPTPLPTPTPKPKGEQAVDIIKNYLGVPYLWGGTSPSGFDCSGLVQYTYKQLGISISRTSYTQVNDGRKVDKSELKAGDLVFFARQGDVHHVGMYIGNGQFIHAPQTGDVVKISNLSDRSDYYTARRIVG